ncbi:unnamed protein product [Microthlaspi erraticum]|uniref:Uncharacterized protein n=1 Tax=Microthlaspi erraticum TaxID=1685480 RepID=A0A6D2I1X3_9BRAS|nr:unnamed protein product [Microthlaspi erraticum]
MARLPLTLIKIEDLAWNESSNLAQHFVRGQEKMMGSFLLKEKNGVFRKVLMGSAIFGLGFYTHDALTPYPKSLREKAKQCLAKAKSLAEERRAELNEMKRIEKKADRVVQSVKTEIAKLEIAKMREEFKREKMMEELKKAKMMEELRKAQGRSTVGTCCESQEESVWSFI